MKIGLIFPNKDRRYKTLHLGLAYIAAYARERHDDLSFVTLDTRVATRKETKAFFNTSFDLIGITVFSPVYFEVKQIFERIRKNHANTVICLGGPYVTTLNDQIFEETPAEFAVYGEGEITFTQLISHLKGDQKLEDILGLMYLNKSGKVVSNPPHENIIDMNTLPFPAYDLFQMSRYPLHRFVTSRGCPFKCSWCNGTSIWPNGYRLMGAKKMIDEVQHLISNYGMKIFDFGDNSFNISLKRLEEFCDLLIQKNIQIMWSASFRAEIMTQEIAYKMRKAGCYNVSIGIESANNKILSNLTKGTTIEKIDVGIKMLKNAGIEIMSQFVIGSPFETLKDVKESIAYAKTSGCDFTNFYMVLPYKGTPQWDYVLQNGTMFTQKIHDFHSMNPRIVFETPEFPYKDRLEAIRLVKKEGFYSNRDRKNWWFDFAKETSRKMVNILPKDLGDDVYMILKSIYRLKIVKKNNL